MPNKQAAMKALRQTKKRTIKNALEKKIIKDLQKNMQKAMKAADAGKVKELAVLFQKKIDKAIKAKWLKKNTANRRKAQMARLVNQFLKK